MKEKNIIIDNDEETDIEEADASEKEFLSLVKGSGSIKLKKCKITTKMFEDKDKNVIKITRFGGFIEFMNSKKVSKGNKEPFAIILEMMQEIKDDMKKGFSEVNSEITTIKEDINNLREDMNNRFSEVHSEISLIKDDISVMKEDISVLKKDVADIKECPTIKKELLELENKKK